MQQRQINLHAPFQSISTPDLADHITPAQTLTEDKSTSHYSDRLHLYASLTDDDVTFDHQTRWHTDIFRSLYMMSFKRRSRRRRHLTEFMQDQTRRLPFLEASFQSGRVPAWHELSWDSTARGSIPLGRVCQRQEHPLTRRRHVDPRGTRLALASIT